MQDAFTFLRTMEELDGVAYSLRDAVNSVVLEAHDARTFEEASVHSNTSLLVVETSSGVVPSGAAPASVQQATFSSPGGRIGAPSSSGGSVGGAANSAGVEDGVIVLDDSLLEVTPKVRRKAGAAGRAMTDVHADVIDLTFS